MATAKNATAKNKNKKVTLSIDTATYGAFQKYCEEHAIWLSKKVELWMKEELKEEEYS